jgi:hypothetical protein
MGQSIPPSALSRRDEDRLFQAARRVLLTGGFPNPQRAGCPGADVLRDIAYRRIELTEAEEWIDHIGSCSPCFTEYDGFRHQIIKLRRVRVAAIAAGIGLFIGIGTLAWREEWRPRGEKEGNVAGRQQAEVFQPFVVDLRDWMVLRGAEEAPRRPPLKLPRARILLSIYLPIGSEPGNYEFKITGGTGNPVAVAAGSARLENHITVLRIKVDLTRVGEGAYFMAIREQDRSWNHYPVVLP